ncbi:MAG TPA: dihydroorotate dehydrogenase-like protein [Bacteroidales bacterium]|nr:dihydroorotate dehydrogenase-like protein [Bacteroidales bacterium]HRZ76582.1 dihydroorotate dehydrogenase-like protein [Bacteroidales bacterium]
MDLSTTYLGLKLKNPLIAGSSGLTNSLDDLKKIEAQGAAAVVLKSIFEEEIVMELEETFSQMSSQGFIYPETMEYFDYDSIEDTLSRYLKLISDAKKELSIPVIASINCVTAQKWTTFAHDIQEAGADAIELNAFILPSDFNRSTEDFEQVYFDIVSEVKKQVSIPVSLKVGYFFSNLGPFLQKLSHSGVDGLVLFNRFYHPDVDIDKMIITASNVLSSPDELSTSLRWIAILSERVGCDLAASTGIHDGGAIVKQILAGAQAVQVASALYKNGFGHIEQMLSQLEDWMEAHDYHSLDRFRGKLSQSRSKNPAAYERVQFMKYFRDRS